MVVAQWRAARERGKQSQERLRTHWRDMSDINPELKIMT